MASSKLAASLHGGMTQLGRGVEHTDNSLDPSANPTNNQPMTIAEWARNSHEVIRWRLDRFNGRDVVDLRIWWRSEHGDLRPGRSGLTLAIRHLPVLAAVFSKALDQACRCGLIPDGEGSETVWLLEHQTANLDAALGLAQSGIPVFPATVHRRHGSATWQKKPFISGWQPTCDKGSDSNSEMVAEVPYGRPGHRTRPRSPRCDRC
jgi:hypothetical protein